MLIGDAVEAIPSGLGCVELEGSGGAHHRYDVELRRAKVLTMGREVKRRDA